MGIPTLLDMHFRLYHHLGGGEFKGVTERENQSMVSKKSIIKVLRFMSFSVFEKGDELLLYMILLRFSS